MQLQQQLLQLVRLSSASVGGQQKTLHQNLPVTHLQTLLPTSTKQSSLN
jgi:hypothetical protein